MFSVFLLEPNTQLLCSLFIGNFEHFMETLELKVEMIGFHSEKRIRKCLSKLRGVKKVEVELSSKKVVVTGVADQNRIVKALRRSGFKSEPWCSKTEILLNSFVSRSYKSSWVTNHGLF